MTAKKYFAYVRVSTARQGQTGTSLAEQRSAIERYARKWSLTIAREYEEQETAAKLGRPVFFELIRALRQGKAAGVVMHKIDRSARNLKDWAELGELIDKGVEVHFANEQLDLYTRGGRLSADIQAVVAADYIRNLREEVKKGFYGRLKQGFYPMPAPVGYRDAGAGQAKTLDAAQSPLVKRAFELYASGAYGLRALAEKMARLGLRTKANKIVSVNSLTDMLHNPFYAGVIRLKKSGECFAGRHEPVITRKLFEQTQAALQGKTTTRTNKKSLGEVFLFRKLLTCERCRYRLIGERQKGYLYYRCQTKSCLEKTVREEAVDESFKAMLRLLEFGDAKMDAFGEWFGRRHERAELTVEAERKAMALRLEKTRSRLSRLTDALVEGLIEQDLFIEKKNDLIAAELELVQKIENVESLVPEALRKTEKFLELANSAYLSYETASFRNKRDLVKTVASNFFVKDKSVLVKLNLPFELVANQKILGDGGARRGSPRTLEDLLINLLSFFKDESIVKNAER